MRQFLQTGLPAFALVMMAVGLVPQQAQAGVLISKPSFEPSPPGTGFAAGFAGYDNRPAQRAPRRQAGSVKRVRPRTETWREAFVRRVGLPLLVLIGGHYQLPPAANPTPSCPPPPPPPPPSGGGGGGGDGDHHHHHHPPTTPEPTTCLSGLVAACCLGLEALRRRRKLHFPGGHVNIPSGS
jgi:hypothetical protein